MRIFRCEFISDDWGVYITPLFSYSWNNNEKVIWFGLYKWLWKIVINKGGK